MSHHENESPAVLVSERRTGCLVTTPFGKDLLIVGNGAEILQSNFVARRRAGAPRRSDPLLREAATQVRAYFARRLARFDLPLHLSGTPLQVGAWLAENEGWFTEDEAARAVSERLAGLPPQLFVDPELRRDPRRMVRAALPLMAQWEILERDGARYRLSPQRRHPQFPFVREIVAYQAAFLQETLEHAAYGERLDARLRSNATSFVRSDPALAPLMRPSAPSTRCAGTKRSRGVTAIAAASSHVKRVCRRPQLAPRTDASTLGTVAASDIYGQ